MVSVRFADMPEQEQQEVGEEQRYSSTKKCATQDVVEIMAVVRADDQQSQSTSLVNVHSPNKAKARRAGYARQQATVGATNAIAIANGSENSEISSRSPIRKRSKLVISRSSINELDQVNHTRVATSDVHILDVVHHNRMSSILALKELKQQANVEECPDFYSP
jgi:hypothetical protein